MAYYQVEVTDTFGGEANYCWVKRCVIPGSMDVGTKADRKLVRDAKAAAGWTGLRCNADYQGEMIIVRPSGKSAPCWIMFITYLDTADPAHPDNQESDMSTEDYEKTFHSG